MVNKLVVFERVRRPKEKGTGAGEGRISGLVRNWTLISPAGTVPVAEKHGADTGRLPEPPGSVWFTSSMSVHGTFRTLRDVRLESGMRTKADVRQRYGFRSHVPI
jgi:hypothetical protein